MLFTVYGGQKNQSNWAAVIRENIYSIVPLKLEICMRHIRTKCHGIPGLSNFMTRNSVQCGGILDRFCIAYGIYGSPVRKHTEFLVSGNSVKPPSLLSRDKVNLPFGSWNYYNTL